MAKKITRYPPDKRRNRILRAAISLCYNPGKSFDTLTRDEVALAANVAPSLVNVYFKTISGLKNAVLLAAITGGHMHILAQAAVIKHPIIDTLDNELKTKIADWLGNNYAGTGGF